MSLFVKSRSFLRNLFLSRGVEADLDREVHSHLGMLMEENIRAGMPPEEAQRAARIELGGVEQMKEQVREVRIGNWLHSALSDCAFGIRQLRKNPGFTVVAVLTLALGIGANAAIFSVVNTVLLRPLSYSEPGRIVILGSYWKKTGSIGWVSQPDFQDWHAQTTAFDAMAYYASDEISASTGSNTDYASAAIVSPEFFYVFSVQPQLGRFFSPEEERPGGPQVVLISDAFWQRNYTRSPFAIGKILRTENTGFTIIGVMPRSFRFPGANDFWLPMSAFQKPGETEARSANNYQAVGRLKPEVTVQAAQAQMQTIGARLEQQYPSSNEDKSVAVVQMQELMVRGVRTTLYLVLGAVALVLLIACANVANLLLARATGRVREIAIRAALGASRSRIVRQLMMESAALALLAGVLGVLLAVWGTHVLIALSPDSVPRLNEVGVDNWVLAFTLLLSLASTAFFGLAPALQTSRVSLNESLRRGSTRSGAGQSSGRLRSALVVAQIAVSVVLVVASGLLLKSLLAIARVNLGFQPSHVLTIQTSVPATDLESDKRAANFYTQLLKNVRELQGITSVAAAQGTPAGGMMSNGGYWLEGGPGPDQAGVSPPQAGFPVITPGYFQTLSIPISKGRDFDEGDRFEAPLVAIISESLARKSFSSSDPLGKRILCGLDSLKWMTIVGVAGDIRMHDPTTPPEPQLYLPYLQHPGHATDMRVLIKTPLDPHPLEATLQKQVRDLNSEVPARFSTLEAMLSDSISASRFRAALIGLFGALALCLAIAGVYGVMAYTVSQRSPEIGARIALGGQSSDILGLVLRQGLQLALAGVAIGVVGAFAMTRFLSSFLFGTQANDPLTFVAVCALLLISALAACIVPARRAMHVDPMTALRCE
jgi:putative ABC transport system permease protein